VTIDVRKAALLAVVAVGASGATAAAATAKPGAKKPAAKAPVVKSVAGPKAAVAPGAKVTVRAQARNARKRAAKVTVTFHLSADKRWDRKDTKLGSATTKRLKPGASGSVRLTAKLPALKPGAWTLLACTGADRTPSCVAAKAKLTVKRAGGGPVTPPAQPAPPSAVPPRVDAPADPPARVPAGLSLQLDDRVEWGTYETPDDVLEPGDVVTTTVRLGAGLPGQAGYTVADVAPEPALTGTVRTIFSFDDLGEDADDVSYGVELPFAVTLGGVQTRRIDVSTNGWLSTTGRAQQYSQGFSQDYRGKAESLGPNVGVVAPFWTDLKLVKAGQRIDYVEAADGSAVAIRWYAETYDEQVPVAFEAVLFSDGRIRFDYLSSLPIGDDDPATPLGRHDDAVAIGLSAGVGGRVAQVDFFDTLSALPTASRLYTPNAVSSTPASAGTLTVEVPRGTTFAGADPACQLTRAPTLAAAGLVTCATPLLDRATASLDVRWQLPVESVFAFVGTAFEQRAEWVAGPESTSGGSELQPGWFETIVAPALDGVAVIESPTSVTAEVYVGGTSGGGMGLRNARISATVPAGLSLESATVASGEPLDAATLAQVCTGLPVPATGGEVVCQLPSPFAIGDRVTMRFQAADAGAVPESLTFAVSADNLPEPVAKTLTVGL